MNSKKESLWSKVSTFLVFAGPATFAFLAVVIVPFLYGVYLTFTSWDGVSSNKPFVGLKNYDESAEFLSVLLPEPVSANPVPVRQPEISSSLISLCIP